MNNSAKGTARRDLALAIVGNKDAFDRLWARLHPQIRSSIGAMPAAGRDGSLLQPTAVAHSIHRLQAERLRDRGQPFKRSDLDYACRRERLDTAAVISGGAAMSDEQADRVFSCLVRNEARTYLADKRRRQRTAQPLDAAPERAAPDGTVLLSLFIDLRAQLEARLAQDSVDLVVLEAVELDVVYGLDPADVASQLGVSEPEARRLVVLGRGLLAAQASAPR